MLEEWRDISGYVGLYQVSNLGRVKSLDRVATYQKVYVDKIVTATHDFRSRILNPSTDKGYLSVVLSKAGTTRTFLIHRLVALAFIPNPDNKPQVNHKNGDTTKNEVTNLEWATERENQQHAVQSGLHARCSGQLYVSVRCVETGQVFEKMADADRWLGCPAGKVSGAVKSGQRVRGYTFEKVA